MEKLISMTDFVLEQNKLTQPAISFKDKVYKYANFIKQPLTLGMFVPAKIVDGVWVVLEEPERRCGLVGYDEQHFDYDDDELREYQEAKERVLFEGFKCTSETFRHVVNKNIIIDLGFRNGRFKRIESLVNNPNWTDNEFLVLTESAKKQIGL